MSEEKVYLLDPKNDYVFKKIFGEKGNEDILMSLINAILRGNPVIKELELLNTEYPKEGVITKGCQFDILAKTDNNITINIEMQYRRNSNIRDRIIYYSDRSNVGWLDNNINRANSASENKFYRNHSVNEYKVGQKYGEKKVISIWIFAENLTEREEPISEIFPCFKENKNDKWDVFTENKRIIIFELKKYKVDNENFKDILSGWVNFLQTPEILDNDIIKPDDEQLEKAIWKLEYMSKDDQERYLIDSFTDYERDYYNDTKTAKEEGLKEGKIEGLKEGKIEGEKNKATEIAKNMLKDNVDVNIISKYSGLSVEEINKLKN